jgi:hypothetical protein
MLTVLYAYEAGRPNSELFVYGLIAVGAAVLCGWFADRYKYDLVLWAFLGLLFSLAAVCGISSRRAALQRNRSAQAWTILGILFGPFALIVWLLPSIAPPPSSPRRPRRPRPPADGDPED